MIRAFLSLLLMFLFCIDRSYAFVAPVSPMQNAVSGVAQAKMQGKGFSTSDPRFSSTLQSIGAAALGAVATVGASAVMGATFPVWAVALLGAAVGQTVYLAVNGDLKWMFNSDGTVQIGDNPSSVNTPAGLKPPQALYCYNNVCAATAEAVCSGTPASKTNMPGGGVWTTTYHPGTNGTCGGTYTFTDASPPEEADRLFSPSLITNNSSACPGIKLTASNGVCPASNFPEPPKAPVKSIPDAATAIPQVEMAKPLNPLVVADIANAYWRQAAAAPGYAGLPYDASNPITAADAQQWQQANPSYWPTVGDFVAPQTLPSGSTSGGTSGGTSSSSSPLSLPNIQKPATTVDTDAQSSPSTNPSTQPLENLGPDPGIGAPSLEPIPTATQIIAPTRNIFPTLKSFVVPSVDVQCPTWSVPVFGKDIAFKDHCPLLEQSRSSLYAAMAVVYALLALFIVLRS
ncbi:hypothetical protein [Herbaspirillum rubrisubalbicans]|uniref:hypothetical protein n=1 Tax=Herbaspirillum rubrisubalbicans TaxID=80842 RepID=UPI0015C579F2|nr:hypothetical protein [Herbaspirillum rubrisubalbicans]